MATPRHLDRIWIAALALAWAADLLFWNHAPGLSFPVWIILALAGLFVCLLIEGKRPHWAAYPLALVTAGLALTNYLRAEPFTRVQAALLSLNCLWLLAATLLNGHWLFYRIGDLVAAGLKVFAASLVRGAISLSRKSPPPADPSAPASSQKGFWQRLRQILPYLRGLILALPVLIILGGLLASADPVFGDQMRGMLKFLDITRLPEFIFRLFYILFFSYLFCGIFLHAVLPQSLETRPDPNQAWKTRFLGSTEAFIVLGGVVAMFAFFMILQFRYLFGGQANISETGYTYADYARRGFFELVWVAVLSLGLYLGMGTITRRETPSHQRAFRVLSILLVGLVLLILSSALQRLLLYEEAYGFTRLRTYTHILIPWLGLLLLATLILEAIAKPGRFGLAFLLFVIGFGITFSVVNVDGLITRLNLDRARSGKELDVATLGSLSADAVPSLTAVFLNSGESSQIHNQAGAALACHWISLASSPYNPDWRTYNYAEASAAASLSQLDLKAYLTNEQGNWSAHLESQPISCFSSAD